MLKLKSQAQVQIHASLHRRYVKEHMHALKVERRELQFNWLSDKYKFNVWEVEEN